MLSCFFSHFFAPLVHLKMINQNQMYISLNVCVYIFIFRLSEYKNYSSSMSSWIAIALYYCYYNSRILNIRNVQWLCFSAMPNVHKYKCICRNFVLLVCQLALTRASI